ncbi:MAG: hypothetical protein U1E13_05050, partial [Methylophilaceae bacterium]|nr:hypothetical protein [Methylophilaceae bacterium]
MIARLSDKTMKAEKYMRKQVDFKLKPSAKIGFMLALALYSSFGSMQHAAALPTGEAVAAGAATFLRDGNTLRIDQSTQQAIVNWQSFSIAADEAVNLHQPTSGLALFRILGSDPSQIFGSLTATGSLFLSNPNGILFAPGAQVDVGSLVATTMRISDQDFLSNQFKFFSDSNAKVSNQGVIRTGDGGYLVLLAEQVENSGTLLTKEGSVVLGSAQSAVLDMFGDGLVKVNLSGDALNAVITQTGNIQADGGQVQIATSARSAAINVSGVVQANSLVERNGTIRLEGGNGAKVSVDGALQALGNENGTTGGEIVVTGEQVALLSNANVDASGQAGGGNVLVGGDYQGKNSTVFNARTTYVAQDANILANATSEGDGGKVIVWADDTTRYYGKISAQGGELAGNGGFVEVSGKRQLDFVGKVDVGATNGLGGQVLLDPENIILNTSTQPSPPNNANGTPDIAFADAPAVGTTIVQIADITGYSELFLQATNDITVANTLTMAVNNSIRLEANNNLNVNAAITTSGTGAITLKADADSSGTGNLAIGGNITSREGGIELSGATITRTAGNIASTGAANQNAGDINISATGAINLGAATITATGGNGSAGNPGTHGGNISITGNGISGTGAITANGGNGAAGTQNGGNAGTISINNLSSGDVSVGNLSARTGNATGLGLGGIAGNIALNGQNITTGTITTQGGTNGAGGNVAINADGTITTGAITTTGGTAATGNSGNNAGNVSLTANQGITTGNIASSGSAGVGAGQLGGNAGNITLINNVGNTVTTGTITAIGGNSTAGAGGAAGEVNITNAGNISTGALTVRTGNSAATNDSGAIGSLNLTTTNGGDITTGAITTTGGTGGNGSDVNILAAGSYITAGNIVTSGGTRILNFSGKNAGQVEITAGNDINIRAITAVGSNATNNNQVGGDAARIQLTAVGDITTNNQALTSRGGNGNGIASGGAAAGVDLQAENIITGSITTSGGTNGEGGDISLNANNNITTGALASSGGGTSTNFAGRNAGAINLDAGGSIITTTIAASGSNGVGAGNVGGNASSITLNAVDSIQTTTLTASGGNAAAGADANGGNAGLIDIAANNTVTTGNITLRTGNSTLAGNVVTAGNVVINGNSVTTGTITATGGNNGIGSNIDITSHTGSLSVGTIVASGGVTNANSNGNNAGNVSLNSADTLNTLAITAIGTNFNGAGTDGGNGGNVDLTGTVITTRSISSTGGNANGGVSGNGGNITLAGNTLLDANTTMAAMGGNAGAGNGGNILFDGTLDASGGNRTLTINSNGNTTFEGAVGSVLALGALTANVGGTTLINGGSVTTTGSQTYGNAVSLGSATTLTTSNANTNLVFTGPVNANGNDLNMNIVRDITANNLSNDLATVSINAGRNVSLRDANAMDFGNSSITGTLNVGTSGNITQSGAVSVTGVTTLAAGAANNITLDNVNNNFSSVTISNGNQVRVVDQNALTINASTVGALLARTMSDNLTLAGNVSASAAGDAIQLVSAGNFITSGNRSLITPSGRWLIYSTSPSSDVRSTNLLNAHDFKQYNASFGDTILGSNDGFIYTIAPTISVDLSGTADKIYDGTLTAPTAGLSIAANPTDPIDGDTIVLGAITSASFADKNAGINKPVTGTFAIASASNGGKPVYGYQTGTVTSTATGTIDRRPISVIVNSGQNKFFGQPDPIFTFSVGDMGLAFGDSLSDAFTGALARAFGELFGTYTINQGTLLETSNYILSDFTGSDFTINPLPPAPRETAALVDANPQLTSYANPQLFV